MRWPTRAPIITLYFFFRWYDIWVGVYIDLDNSNVYICPVPMFGVRIHWQMEDI